MGAVEWTAIAGMAVSVMVGLIVPSITSRRRARTAGSRDEVVSWEKMNDRLQREIDRQQLELDGIDTKYRARLNAMETEYTTKLDIAHAEIMQLRRELETLYLRLGRQLPPAL